MIFFFRSLICLQLLWFGDVNIVFFVFVEVCFCGFLIVCPFSFFQWSGFGTFWGCWGKEKFRGGSSCRWCSFYGSWGIAGGDSVSHWKESVKQILVGKHVWEFSFLGFCVWFYLRRVFFFSEIECFLMCACGLFSWRFEISLGFVCVLSWYTLKYCNGFFFSRIFFSILVDWFGLEFGIPEKLCFIDCSLSE